jgi:sodium pump decarboxylase gamma subunit
MIGRALMVALVGMVVVFIVLILIILCIRLYSGIIGRGGKRRETMENNEATEPQQSIFLSDNSNDVSDAAAVDNTEIIAVISAAIMACMQDSGTGLRVRSIRRIGHTTPIWNVAGRNEQILSKI